MLTHRQPAYDCSGSSDYVLYNAGLGGRWSTSATSPPATRRCSRATATPARGAGSPSTPTATTYGIAIAGLAFDTADFGGPDIPAGTGPRWRQNPTGNLADGLSYVTRHPPGL